MSRFKIKILRVKGGILYVCRYSFKLCLADQKRLEQKSLKKFHGIKKKEKRPKLTP